MNLRAYSRSIKDILTLQRKYIIPRYQREYSWEIEQVEEFWKDITEQFDYKTEEYTTRDYFIGSFVLVGDDEKDTEFMIVDGQQRLTTITILLSVLTHIGESFDKDFANSCYVYIEGKDSDYKDFFKLENESPKPFFQKAIQFKQPQPITNLNDLTTDEYKLLKAYKFFEEKILFQKDKISEFKNFLKALRNQLIRCSTVYITVEEEKDAQTIFETLNAKGKELSTLDLIKNKIFEVLDELHPSDEAKNSWKQLKLILNSKNDKVLMNVFFRHFWIANYAFVTEKKIYTSFQNKIPKNKKSYIDFLFKLLSFARNYMKLISPERVFYAEISIYNSVMAIKDFRVKQPYPLMTTLLGYYNEKLINLKQLIKIFNQLEIFHFIFTAVTSSRASGLESTYSKYSQELIKTRDEKKIKKILGNLSEYLYNKIIDIPYENFEKKFVELKFSNEFTKDKKIIQYIFKNYEKILLKTDELSVNKFSIEHIQSQKTDTDWTHTIGNLLPLAEDLNKECKNYHLSRKIKVFNTSELQQVKEFCRYYKSKQVWTEIDSVNRAKELSKTIYNYSIDVLKNDD